MKNKKWEKGLKIGGFTLLGILVLLLVLPLFFQNKIAQRLLKESDRFLNANVTMEHFHLSLLRTFPHPTLMLKGVMVENKGQFKGITLLKVDDFLASVNLFSVFTDTYKIKKVIINNPNIHLVTTEKGSNWDIVKSEEEKEEEGESHFSFQFDKIVFNNADISYEDVPGSMSAKVKDLDFSLSGNLSNDFTTLKTSLTTPAADFKYNGVKYLSAAKLKLKAAIDADFVKSKYTIKDNEISINALLFSLQGWVAMLDEGMDMDIKLNLPKNDFKNIISLIPAIYAKNFEDIKTSGQVALSAYAKGRLYGDAYPAFKVHLKIDDAMFHYPTLPASVDQINIDALVNSPGGSLDKAVADVRKFHFVIANNPFDFIAHVATPISDPDVAVTLKGILDFGRIKDVYPLEEGKKMSGLFKMNLALAGRLSYVEKGLYEKFKASGQMSIQNLLLQNVDMFRQDVHIPEAMLKFTSAYADLQNFVAAIGKNDLSIKGKVENYIPYIFGNGTLKGSLAVSSSHLNVNDFLADNEESSSDETADTASLSLFKVPANLDVVANLQVKELQYDNMKMTNATLQCVAKDAQLTIQRLAANLFSGGITMNGTYSNPSYNQGFANVNLDINTISTRHLCETFDLFSTFLPVLKKADGDVSFSLAGNTLLDETMSPDYASMNAEGVLGLTDVRFANIETLNKISELLKMGKMKAIGLKDVKVNYQLKDGKMTTRPFSFKVAQSVVDVESGTIGLDKSLHYVAVVTMPSSVLGAETLNMAKSLAQQAKIKGFKPSAAEEIKFAVVIGGTLTKPTLSVGLNQARSMMKDAATRVADDAKTQVAETTNKALDEAQQRADKLVAAAQEKANELVETQRKAGEKLIAAAKAEAQKSIDAAKNPLEKAAKQTAANLAIAEAEKKAARLNAEVKAKADKLVANAKAEGDKLIEAARQ